MTQLDGNFEEFYNRNYKMVYRICFTYLKNPYETEDCTQDVFVKALTKGETFNDEEHEKKWLTVVSMNLCKDRLKAWWRKTTVPIEQCEQLKEEAGFEPDETLTAVMSLPPKYKDLIILYYYQGYKTQEISQMLNKNPSTVRNNLSHARLILKESLGGDFQ